MTIEEFWNQAFLSCLTRLSAEESKKEADKATEICILHWNSLRSKYDSKPHKWKDQDVGQVFLPEEENSYYPGADPLKVYTEDFSE
ncbi:hypothetical protein [Burkholderia vietnamiensis]|uniref:hypothetical protein n=1 Tax=Burkholderia vietnamiensis TaxID=60552 RepID=UPI001D156883|nr:hypothetical protein [Burkholderia vietnamiensis]UEC02567.1 hypothetical protein LK462_11345 [Burkholderia vietnamiensis]